jgi:hypothetical protein
MANITHRIFGSDIPVRVKKRLEAIQNLAGRSRNPGEQIEDTAYKDETSSWYSYNELLGVDETNSSGYLSSKTPFVRMWTAVNLVVGKAVERYDSYFDIKALTKDDKRRGMIIRKNVETKKFEKIHYKERGNPVIYQIGNHQFNQTQNSPNETIQSNTGGLGIEGEFFHELVDNDLFKPQAGIKSVNVDTEGALGVIKKTTVSFTVHNFKDYDEVYSRFFLRPGAQLIVDFGWSDGDLYNPKTLTSEGTGFDLEKRIENILKKETKNGDVDIIIGNVTTFDTKITEDGSFECTLEIVSKNTALFSDSLKEKTRTNIAKNLELSILDYVIYKATDGEMKVTDWTKAPAEQEDIIAALKDRSWIKSTLGREITEQERMDGISFAGSDFSKDIFISIGWLEDNMLTPRFGFLNEIADKDSELNLKKNPQLEARFNSSNSFVTFDKDLYNRQRYGMAEEYKFLYPDKWDISYNVLKNKSPDKEAAYGHKAPTAPEGQNVKKYPNAHKEVGKYTGQIDELNIKIRKEQARIDRSNSGKDEYNAVFGDAGYGMTEASGRKESARKISIWKGKVSTLEATKAAWKLKEDQYFSYAPAENTLGISGPANEAGDILYEKNTSSATVIDRQERRIPLRELFISLDLVKRSLTESSTLSEMLTMILDELNTDSQDVFNLKFAANKYLGHELAIVDANYLNIQWEDRENTFFDKLFQFKPLSPGSIVKDFDFSITTPKDGFQNMMAISTLQSDHQFAPRDNISAQNHGVKVLTDTLDINQLKGKANEDKDISVGFTYIPQIGRSNIINREIEDQMQDITALTFRGEPKVKDLTGKDLSKQDIYDQIAAGKLGTGGKLGTTGVTITQAERDDTSVTGGYYGISGIGMTQGYNIIQPSGKEKFVRKTDYDKAVKEADPDRLIPYKGSGIPRQILTSMKTYYEELARRTHYAKTPMILPVTLTLKIHGTGLLIPGDMFRVDYMPKRYLERVYFQVMKISHEVGSTWTTTLETAMRLRTMKKPGNIHEMADLTSEIYLSPDVFTNAKEFPLVNINKAVEVMEEIRPMFGLVRNSKNLIGVFSFRANKKTKIKIPKHIPYGSKETGRLDTYTGYGEDEISKSPKEFEVTTNKHYFLIINKLHDGTGYIWTIANRLLGTDQNFKTFDIELKYIPSSRDWTTDQTMGSFK